MLKQRVLTAIVLLVVLFAAALAPSLWPLILLFTVAAGCTLWEWLRLTWPRADSRAPAWVALIFTAGLFLLSWAWLADQPRYGILAVQDLINHVLTPLIVLAWIIVATGLVVQGQAARRTAGSALSVFGILAVLVVWSTLVQLYISYGAWFLVSLLALIWFADIAAYFTGKALGKRKLAPRVSPGKTWEGAIGGIIAATLWVVISTAVPGSFGAVLVERWSIGLVILAAILLAAISIVGDLFESLLKRRAGEKDSSQLLPGHGGVYDRLDALLPVAPIAFLLTLGVNA